ncbi:MAG: glycyl-tRNA synthetase [Candidatus Peregrinibacteria bacterium GW2011_GWE2_39_6]|nr:MAG: glycyl-tRNA synthetase [Candidatus Peregrinibacteria bacterium GW2011_GWF2_39_17]KKR25588.1 MAG: glycyl-tRNA synthetase [Candidatus Peregrinibacteria bacterium GW2011_GWE2_39_6]HCW31983.1 hypothetical protein [Candidatus Peregrinibacteria bacterium]
MSLKDMIKKFNQRWKLPDIAINSQEEFRKFKIRILNFMSDIDSHVTESSVAIFCQFLGIPEKWHHDKFDPYNRAWGTNIKDRLMKENDEIEFYKLLQIIFSLDIRTRSGYSGQNSYSKEILYVKLWKSLEFSNVNLAIAKLDNGEIIFYPKGEGILDEVLVNRVMDFLDAQSNTHFTDALKFYQAKHYIKSAEGLRRALEEFLRLKLKNKKGLKENKNELSKTLKTAHVDAQIRNIIVQIFSYLDQYFNENSKHNDGELDDAENEFLIYQTGLLLRYINHVI